jgi:predicted ATPase/DNA-binding XRE family transcriptional regulator
MKETVREEAVSFGAWVRKRRRALDLTQARLGELSACTESTVRKIEADERRPSRRTAERLAQVLHIPEAERPRFIEAARGEQRTDRLEDAGAPPAAQALGNIPTTAGDLIGRDAELALIERRLADPVCRLLTMTGPGGIGKTRLAFAAAERAARMFPDGAWTVHLAAVESKDVLLSAIVQALGVTLSSETDAHTQLNVYLRDRSLLLVLDNFEQLLSATQTVAGLLDAAPRLKLLVTSRERLNLSDEWLLPLQGLTVAGGDSEDITASAAVRLFQARAARVQPGFPGSDEELEHAARICRLVEGTPLAIELAAAWTHLLPCAEILREIERNVDFLRSNARDVPVRHASLRAAFDHSLALLTEEERQAFARLSVFRGAFDRNAARDVAGADLSRLAALADKSLLRQGADGQLAMHELLRQFAAELLARDAAEEGRVCAAHGRYFLAAAVREQDALVGARRPSRRAARTAAVRPSCRGSLGAVATRVCAARRSRRQPVLGVRAEQPLRRSDRAVSDDPRGYHVRGR